PDRRLNWRAGAAVLPPRAPETLMHRRLALCAARGRNILKAHELFVAHANSLAISRWLLQAKIGRNGAGPGLRSSNIPLRADVTIAGSFVAAGIRRVELLSGHDCKLSAQHGAHLCPPGARLPGHGNGARSRGSGHRSDGEGEGDRGALR